MLTVINSATRPDARAGIHFDNVNLSCTLLPAAFLQPRRRAERRALCPTVMVLAPWVRDPGPDVTKALAASLPSRVRDGEQGREEAPARASGAGHAQDSGDARNLFGRMPAGNTSMICKPLSDRLPVIQQ